MFEQLLRHDPVARQGTSTSSAGNAPGSIQAAAAIAGNAFALGIDEYQKGGPASYSGGVIQAKWMPQGEADLWDKGIVSRGKEYHIYRKGELYQYELPDHSRSRWLTIDTFFVETGIHIKIVEAGEQELQAQLLSQIQSPMADAAAERAPLSAQIQSALQQADTISAHHEDASREAVLRRLCDLGYPQDRVLELYDSLVSYIKGSAQVTVNFHTFSVMDILNDGILRNIWERDTCYAPHLYMGKRESAEMWLHGLPPMNARTPAASELETYKRDRLKDILQRIDENMQETARLYCELCDIGQMINDLMNTQPESRSIPEHEKRRSQISARMDELRAQKTALDKEYREFDSLFAGPAAPGQVSSPSDRPHSAALNAGHRVGEAANLTYGTSHMVLRPAIKARSTITAGDSLEKTYKGGLGDGTDGVASFEHPDAAISRIEINTLVGMLLRVLYPGSMLKKNRLMESNAKAIPEYFEVQVFGPIHIDQDVEKLVIDEDELQAIADGQAFNPYEITPIPSKTLSVLKGEIEAKAAQMGIPVQYIHTGREKITQDPVNINRSAFNDYQQDFERFTERILQMYQKGEWLCPDQYLAHFETPPGRMTPALLGVHHQFISELENADAPDKLCRLAATMLKCYYSTPVEPEAIDVYAKFWSFVVHCLYQNERKFQS